MHGRTKVNKIFTVNEVLMKNNKNKNKKFWVQGSPIGYPCQLGLVGQFFL
jgi:hypothetical protein